MPSRRQFFATTRNLLATAIAPFAGWFSLSAAASIDPRPEFAATTIEEVLAFYFGTTKAADDASIKIIASQIVSENQLVPFKIHAPGARKMAVLFDHNPSPLIMAMDQRLNHHGIIIGRARITTSGTLHCYAMRNDLVGHATLRLSVAGKWREKAA